MVQLGDVCKDEITGFEGTAVAITEFLYGCRRVSLQPKGNQPDGTPIDACSFDEPALTVTKAKNPPAKPLATGGPRPEPTRAAAPTRR